MRTFVSVGHLFRIAETYLWRTINADVRTNIPFSTGADFHCLPRGPCPLRTLSEVGQKSAFFHRPGMKEKTETHQWSASSSSDALCMRLPYCTYVNVRHFWGASGIIVAPALCLSETIRLTSDHFRNRNELRLDRDRDRDRVVSVVIWLGDQPQPLPNRNRRRSTTRAANGGHKWSACRPRRIRLDLSNKQIVYRTASV